MNQAYKASYDKASATGDWRVEVLMTQLRNLTVPGAYTPHPQSLIEKALTAWGERLAPQAVKRASRRWQNGA